MEVKTDTLNESSSVDITTQKITLVQKLAYGSGDTACNLVAGTLNALLFLFYTDYVGVNPAIIGVALAFSRIFDGISDFTMGVIIERTKSKYGKARPWLVWMAIPYAICSVLIFLIPPGKTDMYHAIYIFITYNLATTICYTAINLPYGALAALMTRDQNERASLTVFRMAMSPVGRMLSVSCTLPLVKMLGDNQGAWVKVMTMWTILAIVLLVFNFMKCEEKVVVSNAPKENIPVLTSVKMLFKNKYWIFSTILWGMTAFHYAIVGTLLPYYSKYVLGNDVLYSTLYTIEVVILFFGAILCPVLLKKFSKRDVSLCGAILAIIAQFAAMLGPQTFEWQCITVVLRSIGAAPLITLVFAMMADSVEYGQWKTRVRQEGMIFSASGIGFKFASGMTTVVIGAILSAAGYITTVAGQSVVQPQSAINAVITSYHWGMIAVWVITAIVLVFYKLDKMYPDIMKDLMERESRGEM